MTTPDPDGDWIEIGTTDGSVVRRWDVERAETSMRSFGEAMVRLQEATRRLAALNNLPPMMSLPDGITAGWAKQPDPRQGEEVYVYDLLPGARVYVLEDVFTVDRVELDATLPTVWLKELPTSPLYFTDYDAIYLANETED